MATTASWVHGNALTVETPETLSRLVHIGWGTEAFMNPDKSSWMHLTIPTPVLLEGRRAKLQKVFVLFDTGPGMIDAVHVYDGKTPIAHFNGLEAHGDHSGAIDGANAFVLRAPHTVRWGIGISFHFKAGRVPTKLLVATAGADFEI